MKKTSKNNKIFFCIKCAPKSFTVLRVGSDTQCTRCGKLVTKNKAAAYIFERREQLREY